MFPRMKFSKNILAAIVSIVVSVAVSAGYMILYHVAPTEEVFVYIVILVVLTWLVSMLGFDKVKQTLLQIREAKDGTEGN